MQATRNLHGSTVTYTFYSLSLEVKWSACFQNWIQGDFVFLGAISETNTASGHNATLNNWTVPLQNNDGPRSVNGEKTEESCQE